MSVVRRNIVANIAANGWAVLISLAFVPVYIHFLGIEAYGLIGIFLALVAILSLLDLGLGTTLNRELARRSVQPAAAQESRDLLRTLEIVYWIVGAAAGLLIAAIAPFIAADWVNARQLPRESIERAFVIMGLAIACQWPLTLYNGGIAGLQHQVALNAMAATATTVRNVGAAAVLWLVSNTIEAFFLWNVAVSVAHTLASRILLWRFLPKGERTARFQPRLLQEVWRFAAGMTGISGMAIVLTQLDKVILSKVLSLEAFGYYSLAWRVASGLYYLVGPVGSAFFPRYSQLVAAGDHAGLETLYHRSSQLMSVLVLPITIVLALYPGEFLRLWTLAPPVVESARPVLGLLIIGVAVNGLMNLPLMLQLAHGWTRLVFVMNTIAVLVLGPAIYFASLRYGGIGAAAVWIVLNSCYVVFMLPLMHRRLLPGRLGAWFGRDVGLPLAAALAVALAWKAVMGSPDGYAGLLANIVGVSLLTAAAAALAAPDIRLMIRQLLRPAQEAAR